MSRSTPRRRPMNMGSLVEAIRAEVNPPPFWTFHDPDDLFRSYYPNEEGEPRLYTKEVWDRVHWNPPILGNGDGGRPIFGPTDTDADPKPTWDEVVAIWRRWTLAEWTEREGGGRGASSYLVETRDHLISQPVPHVVNTAGIHPGAGLEHMPGLIYSAARSDNAGINHPRAVMRDPNARNVDLWTKAEHHELLEGLAYRTNLVESARNIVHQRIYKDVAVYLDKDQSEQNRQNALDRTLAALQPSALDVTFETEMKKLADKDALPADLPTAKIVLQERLEAVTMRQIKHMRGVVSQQGVDRPAACDDAANADNKVAAISGGAALRIANATTIPAAKTVFDAAARDIEAVVPLNVPIWQLAESNTLLPSYAFRIAWHEWTVQALQPDGVPGEVSWEFDVDPRVNGVGVDILAIPGKTGVRLKLKTPKGRDFKWTLTARNICGPSRAIVVLATAGLPANSPPPTF